MNTRVWERAGADIRERDQEQDMTEYEASPGAESGNQCEKGTLSSTPPTMPRHGRKRWMETVYLPWYVEHSCSVEPKDQASISDLRQQRHKLSRLIYDKHDRFASGWYDDAILQQYLQAIKECRAEDKNLPTYIYAAMSVGNYTIKVVTAHSVYRLLLNTTDRNDFLRHIKTLDRPSVSLDTNLFQVWEDDTTTHLLLGQPPVDWLTDGLVTATMAPHWERLVSDTHSTAHRLFKSLKAEAVAMLSKSSRRAVRAKNKVQVATATPADQLSGGDCRA